MAQDPAAEATWKDVKWSKKLHPNTAKNEEKLYLNTMRRVIVSVDRKDEDAFQLCRVSVHAIAELMKPEFENNPNAIESMYVTCVVTCVLSPCHIMFVFCKCELFFLSSASAHRPCRS